MTQREVGNAFGITRIAVSLWEADSTRPDPDKLVELAELLGQSVDYLMGAEGAGPDKKSVIRGRTFQSPDQHSPASFELLPVLGTTKRSEHQPGPDFWINGEVARHVRRPHSLRDRDDTYGLYIDGTAMEPRYSAGDMIVIDRSAPVLGDDVVIELKGSQHTVRYGNASFLRRFVGRTASTIVVRQFNPVRDATFDSKDIRNVFRVLRLAELLR